jgi:hypothetical protein
MGEDYPYEAKRQIVSLIQTLETLTKRDPEQEVQGIALPVLDAVIESVARPCQTTQLSQPCAVSCRPNRLPRVSRSVLRMRSWSPRSSGLRSAPTQYWSASH